MARYDGVCHHIAVSNGASLFNFFNTPGNATSHFYVRKTAPAGAAMADFEQYVDTDLRAPANLEGNHRLISIETQGGVGADLDAGWTQLQLNRIAWIDRMMHEIHGIPLVAMPNSLSTSRGIGYHRLGIDPWRIEGGELWSESYKKVCPGDARIKQQAQIINLARSLTDDMGIEFSTKVPNYDDAGTDLLVGEALPRGAKAYDWLKSGGVYDLRVARAEKAIADMKVAVDDLLSRPTQPQNVDARLSAIEDVLRKFKEALAAPGPLA